MDNGSQHSLAIFRMPEGGFLVMDTHRPDNFTNAHFACSTIDEALKFIRDKVQPIPATSNPVASHNGDQDA